MSARSLTTVLRTLTDGPAVPDAELLRRFLAGDQPAFAALVRRHARLVWSACRSRARTEAEADDAFQATFLVLLKNARKVRDPARLSVWLYGAAAKVSANARRAAARRDARERRVAAPETNGHAVPGAAWDRALAAVHEEVPALPENLRAPFVLCCLEGVPPSEAARRLGWNPSTLSVRLSRAKDAVLARLDARGLTLGAVAGLGLVAPPSTTIARAAALAHAGSVIPATLLSLSHGVVGMSVNPLKALAATVMVAVGVGGTVGSGWMASAGAQPVPAGPPTRVPVADPMADMRSQMVEMQRRLDEVTAQLAAARAEAKERAAVTLADVARAAVTKPDNAFTTARHQYVLIPANGLDATRLAQLVTDREAAGWEFAGTAPLGDGTVCLFRTATAPAFAKPTSDRGPNPRRGGSTQPPLPQAGPDDQRPRRAGGYLPPEAAPGSDTLPQAVIPTPPLPGGPGSEVIPSPPLPGPPGSGDILSPPLPDAPPPQPARGEPEEVLPPLPAAVPPPKRPSPGEPVEVLTPVSPDGTPAIRQMGALPPGRQPTVVSENHANDEEIRRLEARLAELKNLSATKPTGKPGVVVSFEQDRTPLTPGTLAKVLGEMGQKKFGVGTGFRVQSVKNGVTVTGTREMTDWAAEVVRQLGGQSAVEVRMATPTR